MLSIKYASLFFLLLLNTISCVNRPSIGEEIKTKDAVLDSIFDIAANRSLDRSFRLKTIDSLLWYAIKRKNKNYRYKGLMLKTSLFSKIEIDSAVHFSKQLRDIALQNNDSLYIGKALIKLGLYHRNKKEIERSFEYYNRAYVNFKSINDSANTAKSLLEMSKIQKSLGDFVGSRTTAIEGLGYLNVQKDTVSYIGLLQNISTSFREEGNYIKALHYNNQALQLSPSNKIHRVLKNTKANILTDILEYDEAIKILNELRDQAEKLLVKKENARVLTSLAYVKWLKTPNNKLSKNLFDTAYTIRLNLNDTQGLISSGIRITQYYEKTNPKKALAYAEQTLQNATKINSQTAQLEALDYIVKLKTNPKEEALLYVEIDKKLTKLNRQNRELYSVTKFENEKLLKENLTLEADRLKKQKLNAWYLLGFIATVLLSVMVYIVLKNRHTKEKQQKVHETEARISKKIHDELANDVYSTMVQLENKSAKIPKIINELEEIYHKARDISQEKSVFKNNDEYVSDLKKMLGSFTSNDTNIIVQGLTSVIWIDIQEPKKVTTLRVLKELLVNMKKHSKATIVTILFLRVQNNLKITYIDDGIGMYKNLAINGSGLVNAENRIHAIDGKFTFDETITKGLKIKMNIPI